MWFKHILPISITVGHRDKIKDRWAELVELSQKHIGTHTWMFDDAHLMMIACGGQKPAMAERIMKEIKQLARYLLYMYM